MTITLDQSRKLWELGVRKEAGKSYQNLPERLGIRTTPTPEQIAARYHYPAYNAEELIAMMQGMYQIYIRQDKRVEIYTEPYSDEKTPMYNTLTQALCNKLIYDIENGIITVEEINK
jgi:hypothetical protein